MHSKVATPCTSQVASFCVSGVVVERISLPSHLSPTCFLAGGGECVSDTESRFRQHARPWYVSVEDAPVRLWLVAFASAVPITFFFYMDQNISSLLCQLPKHNLKQGHYYHSSFLWMGLFNAVGPAFGLPFVTGSLPHSPQFVRALTYTTKRGGHAVAESRVAPLLVYLGIGVPLLLPSLVHLMPHAAIDGVLAFVGAEGILETQLWRRLLLLITPAAGYPQSLRKLRRPASIHLFTLMQLTLLGLCWVINLSPFGLFVSFLIVSLVPAREHLLPGLFSAAELAVLDPVEPAMGDEAVPAETEDQFDEEELEVASLVHGLE